jgi:hypothetical protein
MPAEKIQAPIFAEPQQRLEAVVDTARQAAMPDDDRYKVMHDHIKGNLETTEIIGDRKDPNAPRIQVEQHRIDAIEGSPDSDQIHTHVTSDPVTGDVNTGMMVNGVRENGERYSHVIDTHSETVQHVTELVAQRVIRETEAAQAAQTEQPHQGEI